MSASCASVRTTSPLHCGQARISSSSLLMAMGRRPPFRDRLASIPPQVQLPWGSFRPGLGNRLPRTRGAPGATRDIVSTRSDRPSRDVRRSSHHSRDGVGSGSAATGSSSTTGSEMRLACAFADHGPGSRRSSQRWRSVLPHIGNHHPGSWRGGRGGHGPARAQRIRRSGGATACGLSPPGQRVAGRRRRASAPSSPRLPASWLLLNECGHPDDADPAGGPGSRISPRRAVDVDRHDGRRTAGGSEHALQRDAPFGHVRVVPQQQRVQAINLGRHTVLHRHEDAGDLTLALREGSIQLGVDHVRIGPGDHLREHRATDGADWRRPKLLVPSVCLARISVLPVLPILPVTNECGIIGTERVVHPRARHLIDVLGVDEEGRLRRTITRIARIARLDDHLSYALPMLAVVAFVALVSVVALVAVVALVVVVALVALLSVDTRGAVLSVTDDHGVVAPEGVVDKRPRHLVDVLGVDQEGRLRRTISRVARIARLDEHLPDALSMLAVVALVPLVSLLTVGTRGAVLSVTDDRGVVAPEGVVDERIRDVVDVLGVDEEGRLRRTIDRVARIARLDEHFPDALPMLTVVALVALVSVVALVALVSVIALVAVVPLVALRSVGTRGAVLSVTDDRGVVAPEGVVDKRIRDLVDVLGVDQDGRLRR